MGCFWPKYIMFKLKKYKGVIFHDTKEWCKFEEQLTYGLVNDMKNLEKFHQSTLKSQNWDFYLVLLSKVENELKFYRGVMCYENEEWLKMWNGVY